MFLRLYPVKYQKPLNIPIVFLRNSFERYMKKLRHSEIACKLKKYRQTE
jgi:hypothetical protein